LIAYRSLESGPHGGKQLMEKSGGFKSIASGQANDEHHGGAKTSAVDFEADIASNDKQSRSLLSLHRSLQMPSFVSFVFSVVKGLPVLSASVIGLCVDTQHPSDSTGVDHWFDSITVACLT
jgi:hypothetical protein